MLEVRLFPKSQIRLYNNALINLNPRQQIQNPLNQRVQVFLHLNQSYNFLMQLEQYQKKHSSLYHKNEKYY